jgi:hypothetical protein
MPARETLILAVTRMLGGMCIAGMTTEPDAVTGLRWVRPTREHGHVLLGDITTPEGQVLKPFDVVELNLLHPRPTAPHVEDWIADFVHHRPRVLRRLEGGKRADFLARYIDTAPLQVVKNQERSLCLVRPDWVKGAFHLDNYSGKLDARISFGLKYHQVTGSHAKGGVSVTDLTWRALGRAWLGERGSWTEFDEGDLESRLGITQIYLAVGLTRAYRGEFWAIVIGVHTVPDVEAIVDYDNM